jgi:hypothetical protein
MSMDDSRDISARVVPAEPGSGRYRWVLLEGSQRVDASRTSYATMREARVAAEKAMARWTRRRRL